MAKHTAAHTPGKIHLWPTHWMGGSASYKVNGENAPWLEFDDAGGVLALAYGKPYAGNTMANMARLALCWNEHDRLEAENKRLKEALEIDRTADAELKGLLAEENWRLRALRDELVNAAAEVLECKVEMNQLYAGIESERDVEAIARITTREILAEESLAAVLAKAQQAQKSQKGEG